MMRAVPRVALAATLLAVGVSGAAPFTRARAAGVADVTAVASSCGARVAVLGHNMSAGGRFEVQRVLRVGAHTVQQDETQQDAIQQSDGLIPAALLGKVAVSSALLGPLPAGSGLTVSVNRNITLDTPQSYANALLTAGVTDAEVRVAAPTSQKALGTTALLGLLRAAQISCLSIAPARRVLAIREAVLSDQLAQAAGPARYGAVPSLINTLKGGAVSGRLTTPATLGALVSRDAAARGIALTPQERQGIVGFLGALVASKTYEGIAARSPQFTPAVPGSVHVGLNAAGAATPPRATSAPATPAGSGGATHHGAVQTVDTGHGMVTVQETGGRHAYKVSPLPELAVTRNGQTSTFGALKPGDKITFTVVNGLVTAIEATSPSSSNPAPGPVGGVGTAVSRIPTAAAPVTSAARGLGTAGIAVLAALLLLVLLLLPLLIGLLRRRRERNVVTTTTTTMPAVPDEPPVTRLDTESDVRSVTYAPRRVVRRAGGKGNKRR